MRQTVRVSFAQSYSLHPTRTLHLTGVGIQGGHFALSRFGSQASEPVYRVLLLTYRIPDKKYSTLLLSASPRVRDNFSRIKLLLPEGDSKLAENPMNSPQEQQWGENLLIVLMADDDEDDYLLVKSAFEAGQNKVNLRWVDDGQKAMDYLLHRGKYMVHESAPRPDLILLDLMMPRKDGLETLREIKGHRNLQKIPVVLLTSSKEQEHKSTGLMLGADSFIVKPNDFEEMVQVLGVLHEHYFGIICLPFCGTGLNH